MTNFYFQCSKILVVISLVLISLARFFGTGRTANGNLLAYIDNDYDWQAASLILYDVNERMSVPVFTTAGYIRFNLSHDGRLVYSANKKDNGEIYLLDTRSADPKAINITQTPTMYESLFALSPDGRYLAFLSGQRNSFNEIYFLDTRLDDQQAINITQNPNAQEYSFTWSPDGHYLSYVSSENEKRLLYVWNGETVVNITPEDMLGDAEGYHVAWSDDGRLAFTVLYGFGKDKNNEIYLWNGETTTNLSQNPAGKDELPVWNADGRIAFLSARDDEYDIYVWDGISVKDGSPDFDTFTNVAPELTMYTSYPTWTNTGLLSFSGYGPQDKNAQIYVWDGESATNISQNPTLHNGSAVWSSDGRWAFVTFASPKQLFVRDADNKPLLTTKGQYAPAWSPNGYLLFCVRSLHGWSISVWDGQEVIKVTRGDNIYNINAQWENGEGVFCSNG